MARPVQYNIYGKTDVKLVKEGPEGYMGEAFMATTLEQVVGLARKKIPSGHCLLPPPAAGLSSWPPWERIMTWQGLALSG